MIVSKERTQMRIGPFWPERAILSVLPWCPVTQFWHRRRDIPYGSERALRIGKKEFYVRQLN